MLPLQFHQISMKMFELVGGLTLMSLGDLIIWGPRKSLLPMVVLYQTTKLH